LKAFDSEFAKYQLAFGDAPLKKEDNGTVPTLPNVESQSEPPAVTHATSTSAATGKHNGEPDLSDGNHKNTKKKAKKNVSRQVTLPQSSSK
jgi:hypothetical protein